MADPAVSSLGFDEAVAYLRKKVPLGTERWDDIKGQQHDHHFVVAGAAKAELLTDLHAEVLQAVRGNVTLDEFRKNFDQIVAKHGWTGWTGEGTAAGRAWRTKVIYTTNLRTAYAAGRLAQMRAIQHERPFWRYRHNDTVAHPRPLHQSWNGLVLRADDPWWFTHYPQNGWGCRCYVESLSQRDLDSEGLTVSEAPDDGTYDYVNKRTGEVHRLPKGIDYGWDHMPGATRDLAAELKTRSRWMPKGIGNALRRAIQSVTERVGAVVERIKRLFKWPRLPRQAGVGLSDGSDDPGYAAIRGSTTDVAEIAGATGLKPGNVQRVKDHLFYTEHLLDRHVPQAKPALMGRFDSDAQTAAAWQRLRAGTHGPADMAMLRHETAEAWYMRRHGPGYNAAHNAADARYPSPVRPGD